MNDEEFGSRKVLKLKYRRGNQIIQTFCKIGYPQKLDPPSLICRNSKTLKKGTPESSGMDWNLMNDQEIR